MGANTYIGNGPNFMVKAIAEKSGVAMPSFFGYLLYSGGILIPLFVLGDVLVPLEIAVQYHRHHHRRTVAAVLPKARPREDRSPSTRSSSRNTPTGRCCA